MDPVTTDQADPEHPAAKRRVLCVQPVREHLRSLQLALAAYDLRIAHTGLDAVRVHNAGAIDAYILDYWLPDWSGLSLCRQIRRDDLHAPVLFFSSAEGEAQRSRALRAGADAYLLASAGAEVLAVELTTVLRYADARTVVAKAQAEEAVKAELERRRALLAERSEFAQSRAAEALARVAKVRAQKAFTEAGGTLGQFARWWLERGAATLGIEP